MKQSDCCAAASTTQQSPTLNRCADKPIVKSEPFGLRAAWLHFANELEVKRLAKLHMRIQRRKRGLDDLVTERQRIMNRCIRRMRRQNGKN
jgi:hypothetical protein